MSKTPHEKVDIIEMKVTVPLVESILINKELAKKMVGMILLPQD